MNSNSINGLTSDNLRSTLQDQLASNNLAQSSNASKKGQLSPFAQLLSDTAAISAVNHNSSNSTVNQFNQLVANYQKSGVQNQSQSLDPNSLAF